MAISSLPPLSNSFFSSNPNPRFSRQSKPSSPRSLSIESLPAKSHLLTLIADQDRGLKTQQNPSKRAEIINAIEDLAIFGKKTITTDSSLSGTWRMLWTTEKEQLFIIKNAGFFGTQAGDVLQVIDVEKGFLKNVITFPPFGVFFVRSEIEPVPPQRVNFRFTSAVLRGKAWKVPLPPFGQGWCEKCGSYARLPHLKKRVSLEPIITAPSPPLPSDEQLSLPIALRKVYVRGLEA